nr:ABC transporter subunit A [Microheliella maris]
MYNFNFFLIGYKLETKNTRKKSLCFSLVPGQCLIVLGPNGCGKSTFLRKLIGLYSYNNEYSSFLKFFKKYFYNIFELKDHSRFYIPLNYIYPGGLNIQNYLIKIILKNYYFFSLILSIGLKSLDIFQIKNFKELTNKKLSSGEKQRIYLTKLLFNFSPIWILDEPSLTLDAKHLKSLEELFFHFQKLGGIIILTSHSKLKLKNTFSIWVN